MWAEAVKRRVPDVQLGGFLDDRILWAVEEGEGGYYHFLHLAILPSPLLALEVQPEEEVHRNTPRRAPYFFRMSARLVSVKNGKPCI